MAAAATDANGVDHSASAGAAACHGGDMTRVPDPLGWFVLGVVYVDEILAVTAAAIFGEYAGGWPLAIGLAVSTVVVWWAFGSPRAPLGGPVVRPLVKALVFTSASAGLWAAGHEAWGVGYFAFSAVVNLVAQHPDIRRLPTASR